MKAEHAIVRVFPSDEMEREASRRVPEGGGVRVDDRHVLTCAHVLGAAGEGDTVWVDFSHIEGNPALPARVVRRDDAADVAVLEMSPGEALPEAAVPARFMTAEEDAFRREVHICGFPADRPLGDWIRGEIVGETGEGWLQIDHALTSKLVKPGFSGAPAWLDDKRRAAGLVVQRFWKEGESSAYVAPVKKLLKVFPGLQMTADDFPSDSPSVSRSVNVRGKATNTVVVTGNGNTIQASYGPEQRTLQTNSSTAHQKETETIPMDFSILHLSDLHFGGNDQADLWAEQLISDLTGELHCEKLDALVVSGDVSNKADPAEFAAGRRFLDTVSKAMNVEPSGLVVVPGNHDLSWKDGKKAYELKEREDLEDGELREGFYFDRGDEIVSILADEEQYKTRFRDFGEFHKAATKTAYQLEYARQAPIAILPGAKLVIAGFNSAWQIDHHFRGTEGRASINPHAVSHVLNVLRERKETRGFLKIAVWHHPVESPFEDRITDHGFLERLVQAGFCVGLHGHLHKSVSSPFVYEHGPDGRKMHIIGAGTFGAPTKEMTPGVPLQYHLLTGRGGELEIATRKRPEPNGAWEPDAVWRQGPRKDPSSRLLVSLQRVETVAPVLGNDGPVEPEALEIPYLYREWINDHCADMDFTKLIGTGPAIQAKLPEIFIPLTATPPEASRKEKEAGEEVMERQSRERDIEELIGENQALLIEGEAGSGKTTLLKHYAYTMLQESGNDSDPVPILPVLVLLRRIKNLDLEGLGENVRSAESLLAAYFGEVECGLDMETVSGFCGSGRCAILLDGLDEISPSQRKGLADAFSAFRRKFLKTKIVLSGRPHGMDDAVRRRFGRWKITINDLAPSQVEAFIHQWFTHVFQRETRKVIKTARDMIGEIRSHGNIEALVGNPLMLTAVCLLYLDDKELPGQRSELYDRVIDNLLHRRFKEPESIRQFLMALAKRMHLEKVKGVDRVEALKELQAALPGPPDESTRECAIRLETKFDVIEPACGLLRPGDGQYEFQHLTFQEFLAAAAIASDIREEGEAKVLESYWGDPHFEEMVELYIGYRSIHSKGTANYLVSEVLNADDRPPFHRWRLAARSLLDIHPRRREASAENVARERMLTVMSSNAETKARADAGETLGRLGDPRDLKAFVPIPAGTYNLSMGEVEIETPFEIGKYPVTNGWFREFVAAGGYENTDLWTPEGRKWLAHTKAKAPAGWHDRKWNNPSAPVVGVCWWEAAAFLEWLTRSRDDGWRYGLPSEIQWEAAAAGKEGKGKYPWRGDWAEDHCNSSEGGLGKTSVVGVFPKGDTPERVVDLSGNVWEWLETDYHSREMKSDYPFDEEVQALYDAGEYLKAVGKYEKNNGINPMLRGGGWSLTRSLVARASRSRNYPDQRDDYMGFRAARTLS